MAGAQRGILVSPVEGIREGETGQLTSLPVL